MSGPQVHGSLVDASCVIAESVECATSNMTENLFELSHVTCFRDVNRNTRNRIRRRTEIS